MPVPPVPPMPVEAWPLVVVAASLFGVLVGVVASGMTQSCDPCRRCGGCRCDG